MYRVGSALRADLVVFGFSGKRLALRPPHGGRRVGAGLRHAPKTTAASSSGTLLIYSADSIRGLLDKYRG
jgi:hypothetical protein